MLSLLKIAAYCLKGLVGGQNDGTPFVTLTDHLAERLRGETTMSLDWIVSRLNLETGRLCCESPVGGGQKVRTYECAGPTPSQNL